MRDLNTRELPDNLSEVISLTSTAHLTKKNEKKYHDSEEWRDLYHRAKTQGDIDAAFTVVTKLMASKEKELRALCESLQGEKVTLVPVLSETNSKNVLPAAYALALEELLDAKICYDVEKKNSQKLTNSTISNRLPSTLEFQGKPENTQGKFIIVDDNFTSGKTITSLMAHLQKHECEIHCVMTLASSRYSKRLRPTDEQIERVFEELKLDNNKLKEITGHGIEQFTGAELQSIILMRCNDKQQWFRDTYSRPVQGTGRNHETEDARTTEELNQGLKETKKISLRERGMRGIKTQHRTGLRRNANL